MIFVSTTLIVTVLNDCTPQAAVAAFAANFEMPSPGTFNNGNQYFTPTVTPTVILKRNFTPTDTLILCSSLSVYILLNVELN